MSPEQYQDQQQPETVKRQETFWREWYAANPGARLGTGYPKERLIDNR